MIPESIVDKGNENSDLDLTDGSNVESMHVGLSRGGTAISTA